jgi:hypothetical protein
VSVTFTGKCRKVMSGCVREPSRLRMRKRLQFRSASDHGNPPNHRLPHAQQLEQGHHRRSLLLPSTLTGVSIGLGLLSVNSSAALSDSLPTFLTSVFPATPAPAADVNYASHTYAEREELSETKKIKYGCLIPVLVILSGVFAGLTLGYVSLDETQLNVPSIGGTP